MELAQQLDDIVLRRSLVAQALADDFPDFLDASMPVHEPDDEVRLPAEPVEALTGAVLEDVPDLTTILVTVDPRVASQSRLELRYPVPGATEQWRRHAGARGATPKASGEPNRRPGASRSRRATGGRRRSCRCPPCPVASGPACGRASPRLGNSCGPHGPWRPA